MIYVSRPLRGFFRGYAKKFRGRNCDTFLIDTLRGVVRRRGGRSKRVLWVASPLVERRCVMGRWVMTFDSRSSADLEGAEVRGLLKVALRRFGLRCVEVRSEVGEVERRELL